MITGKSVSILAASVTAGAVLALLASASPVRADVCLESSIDAKVERYPYHFGSVTTDQMFDGLKSFSSRTSAMRLHQPTAIGDNALIIDMGTGLLQGTTFTFHYTVHDASGRDQAATVKRLNENGYDQRYFDSNRNGQLDLGDFDTDGNGRVELGSKDYSPIGFVVRLYSGDPGDPVGSGSGRQVQSTASPIQLLTTDVYSFTMTAEAQFDHLVVESTPDSVGGDAHLLEIEINGKTNSAGGSGTLCDQPEYVTY